MTIDWFFLSDTILREPAELHLSVCSIVIIFVASGTWRISERTILTTMIINDINLLMRFCNWSVLVLCNIVDSRNVMLGMPSQYFNFVLIKQFWMQITPIRIPGGLRWYLVQWTYSAQYSRPVLSSCGHLLICCLSPISNRSLKRNHLIKLRIILQIKFNPSYFSYLLYFTTKKFW